MSFVFRGETRYAAARRTIFFQQAREGAPHYGPHTLQKTATARKPNAAFMKPPDPQAPSWLNVVASGSRAAYRGHQEDLGLHQKHNLQDASNSATSTPTPVCAPSSAKTRSMTFELTKLVNAHLK